MLVLFSEENNIYNYTDQVGNIRLAYYKDASGNLKTDRTTNYYPFGLEFGGDLNISNSITPITDTLPRGRSNKGKQDGALTAGEIMMQQWEGFLMQIL